MFKSRQLLLFTIDVYKTYQKNKIEILKLSPQEKISVILFINTFQNLGSSMLWNLVIYSFNSRVTDETFIKETRVHNFKSGVYDQFVLIADAE